MNPSWLKWSLKLQWVCIGISEASIVLLLYGTGVFDGSIMVKMEFEVIMGLYRKGAWLIK